MTINSIFKSYPPKEDIINILNKALFEKGRYIINKNFYKQLIYNKNINKIIDILKSHYIPSKAKIYLEREISFNNFCTIIRHFCKLYSIPYYYKVLYNKSKHEVVYYILLN